MLLYLNQSNGGKQLISIVILTFNSINFIEACLVSVFKQIYHYTEVIIVDDASGDGTVDFIKKKYPQVKLMKNNKSAGACFCRNLGIKVSSGDWILTLDCDVVLAEGFFDNLINYIDGLSPDIGAIQPKILKADTEIIDSCGLYLSWGRRFYDIGRGKNATENFNKQQHIFGVSSACAIYRKKMLENIKDENGYFDQRFFFLVEDVDLAWRAQRKRWQTYFLPALLCFHKGNSSNTDFKRRQYLCFRNRWLMIIKNEGLWRYNLRILPLLFYDLPRFCYLLLSNKYLRRN